MKAPLTVLLVATLLASPALAEGASKPGKPVVLANVTCAELKPGLRARHPECKPQRSKAATIKPLLVTNNRGATSRKKLTKMPWMIGVFQ